MAEQENQLDHLLDLQIDSKRLYAVLKIDKGDATAPLAREPIVEFLVKKGMDPARIRPQAIDALIELATKDPRRAHEMQVVEGTPPAHGVNASFEFDEKISQRIDEIQRRNSAYIKAHQSNTLRNFKDDDDKAINFYEESPFIIVREGQRLGRVIEATPGEDGIDVSGQPLPARPGKDLSSYFDNSITKDRLGNIHAVTSGHMSYAEDYLRVNQQLCIEGCVDFSTGNIDFTSDVEIRDGVRDRFTVKADGCIEIHSLVEASTLISAADIILHTGMAGRKVGTVHAAGSVISKYLECINAAISGDCTVSNEITNCMMVIAGKLNCPSATLRGGEVCAAKGGVIGSLGSIQGVKTHLILGWIPEIDEQLRVARVLEAKLRKELVKHSHTLAMLRSSIGKPNPQQARELGELESEVTRLTIKLEDIDAAAQRLTQIILEHTQTRLDVHSLIYAKSTLWVPGYQIVFDRDIKGELLVSLDKRGTPIITRGGKSVPLSSVAQVVPDERVLAVAPIGAEHPSDQHDAPPSSQSDAA